MDKKDRSLLASWGILVALTIASFESAWGLAWIEAPAVAIAVVICVALLKVRIVVLDFMEVRHAPWALRLPLEAWIVTIAAAILAFWYSAGA
jgi:Prokaryotic Cytochrome C oxidase subunit IV